MTAPDAARYFESYEAAIQAIGVASAGRGIYQGPGISIKLSALHPRYCRAQADRVIDELVPAVARLAKLAKTYNIGLNIDAEEADRLELSLDILDNLCRDPELEGWNGLGFVVQAYGKRCPFVIDYLIDLARRHHRRLMIRLVKGAYWDAEIKRAQSDGLEDFPVYTRKIHTDIAYIACARKLLAAPDAVYPQFATHNAQTVATIFHLGEANNGADYEFQCLHGMGEALYEQVVGRSMLDRPVRIYAPVGSHESLLAYLVRRLPENGANSSFVNRIADANVSIADLVAEPAEIADGMADLGAPHEKILLPADIYGKDRYNSRGLDLSDETVLRDLQAALAQEPQATYQAGARLAEISDPAPEPIRNPGDRRDLVGTTVPSSSEDIERSMRLAVASAARWAKTATSDRAAALRRAADMFEARRLSLLGLLVREAGKTASNAVGEVRETVDFLRYYAEQLERSSENSTSLPLGCVVCISPWNFPLAIFTGQVAAALAAGNAVLAKPAEETPLIAAQAVQIFHDAGIPPDVLLLLPGDGRVGAQLVANPEIGGVMFTGSTGVAKAIQAELAKRTSRNGHPIPLVAETGGRMRWLSIPPRSPNRWSPTFSHRLLTVPGSGVLRCAFSVFRKRSLTTCSQCWRAR